MTVTKHVERTNKAAVRSLFSQFDIKVHKYGLFGQYGLTDENIDLYEQMIALNLSNSNESNVFKYAVPQLLPDSARLVQLYTLADHTVVKRQILEDMKYKAPFEFAIQIINKWKETSLPANLNRTSQFYKKSEKIEALIAEREQHLDKAWQETVFLYQSIEQYETSYAQILLTMQNILSQIAGRSYEDIVAQMDSIAMEVLWMENYCIAIERDIFIYESQIAALSGKDDLNEQEHAILYQLYVWKEELMNELAEVQSEIHQLDEEYADLERILDLIEQYAQLVTDMKQTAMTDDESILTAEIRYSEHIGEARRINRQIRNLLEESELDPESEPLPIEDELWELVINDHEFDQYQSGVGAATAAFHAFSQQISMFEDKAVPLERLIDMNLLYGQLMNETYHTRLIKEQERSDLKASIQAKEAEVTRSLQTILDQIKSDLLGCPSSDEGRSNAGYITLLGDKNNPGLYDKYMDYNDYSRDDERTPHKQLSNAGQTAKATFGFVDRLLSAVKLAEVVRDKIYINEYAISHFDNRTHVKNHVLSAQEVEFITYGLGSCEANYAAAYIEMFTIRLAIRTVEFLMEPGNRVIGVGSPLLAILSALAYGAGQAYDDMARLINGEDIPLFNKLGKAITLNYQDYLRLFLFMHSDEQKVLSRMQSLIELNTGRDLTRMTTYVQAANTTSIRLWFIPAVMDFLHSVGVTRCDVRGDQCQLTHSTIFSY